MLEIIKKLMASATTWDWDAMGAPNWLEVTTWEDPAEALVYAGLTLGCCEAMCFGISRVKILWIRQGPMLSLWVVDSTRKQECSSGGSRQSNRDSHVPKLYHTWPKKNSQVFADCLQHTLSGWSAQAGWGNNDYTSKRQNRLGLKESGAITNSREGMVTCGCLRF